MPFEFINNNSLNNATRRTIRSHAALGKSRGKRLLRRSRKDVLTAVPTPFRVPLMVQAASEAENEVQDIERPVGDGLLFPGLLPGESKGLVKKVVSLISSMRFSPEMDNGLDYRGLGAPICVQYMFVDEACKGCPCSSRSIWQFVDLVAGFHSTMAMALICLDKVVNEPKGKLQAMRHVLHTFRLLKQKLYGETAVTDQTIAAVISMAQYEHQQHNFLQGSAHIQGLWRIAQLRGGVSNLPRSLSGLGQKMLRVDLEYALQLGSPTLFRLEEAEIGCMAITQFSNVCLPSDHSLQSQVLGKHLFRSLSTDFRDLLVDVLSLALLLNNAISGIPPKVNAVDLHQSIILLGYRLVKLKPLGLPLETSALENRIHLGLTAFLMSFLLGWDGQIAQNELLAQLLLAELQTTSNAGQDEEETFLWLLFIGAVSPCLRKHPTWISTTRTTLWALNIENWEDVRKILGRFPWVDAVHNSAGQALWDDSCGVHLSSYKQ